MLPEKDNKELLIRKKRLQEDLEKFEQFKKKGDLESAWAQLMVSLRDASEALLYIVGLLEQVEEPIQRRVIIIPNKSKETH